MPVSVRKYVGNRIFNGCQSLTQVELPQGIEKIPYDMFCGCSSLKEITIPESVESIGVQAFASCVSLEKIEFPKGVRYVSASAFADCTALKEITFPSKLESIWDNAFRNCTALTTVYWPKTLTRLGDGAFENCVSLKNFPNTTELKTIGKGAFKNCSSLQQIPVFLGLEVIGPSAFEHCTGLTRVDLPETVTELGDSAFALCLGLETLYAHGTVTKVGKDVLRGTAYRDNPLNWKNHGLYWGTVLMDLEKLTAETYRPIEGTTVIAGGVFGESQNVTTVIIPDGVTYVNEGAVDGSTTLKTLVMGKDVTVSGEIIMNCTSLKTVYWEEEAQSLADGYWNLRKFRTPLQIVGNGQGAVYGWAQNNSNVTYLDVNTITLGDPNGDGQINAKDALMTLQAAVETIVPYGKQAEATDVNVDEKTDAKDALEILKFTVGKPGVLSNEK